MPRISEPDPVSRVTEPMLATSLDRRQLLHALQRMRSGDFSVQLPGD